MVENTNTFYQGSRIDLLADLLTDLCLKARHTALSNFSLQAQSLLLGGFLPHCPYSYLRAASI
jgi:hypothetical protein